jgi:hypothetical protein
MTPGSSAGARKFKAGWGSAGVVVLDVLAEHALQVPLPDDQHLVGALGPDGPHDALSIGIHPRASRRREQHLDPLGVEDRVERVGELPGLVPDEVPVATRSRRRLAPGGEHRIRWSRRVSYQAEPDRRASGDRVR